MSEGKKKATGTVPKITGKKRVTRQTETVDEESEVVETPILSTIPPTVTENDDLDKTYHEITNIIRNIDLLGTNNKNNNLQNTNIQNATERCAEAAMGLEDDEDNENEQERMRTELEQLTQQNLELERLRLEQEQLTLRNYEFEQERLRIEQEQKRLRLEQDRITELNRKLELERARLAKQNYELEQERLQTEQIRQNQNQTSTNTTTNIPNINVLTELDLYERMQKIATVTVKESQTKTMSVLADGLSEMYKLFDKNMKEVNSKLLSLEQSLTVQRDMTNVQDSEQNTTSTRRTNRQTNHSINGQSTSHPSDGSSSFRDTNRRIDVHKWGVKFDGSSKGMSVGSFIFRVEKLQKKSGLTDDQLFANFHHLVTGSAERWYWDICEENQDDELFNYHDLKAELIRQFQHNRRDHEIQEAIMKRKQQPHETFDDFYADIRGLTLQMQVRPKEDDLVSMVRKNLKERISTLVFGCAISNIRELREECKRAEEHLALRDAKIKRFTHEIDVRDRVSDLEEEEYELAAFQAKRPERKGFRELERYRGQDKKRDELKDKQKPFDDCPSSFHTLTCFCCGQGSVSFRCAACQGNPKVGSTSGSQPPTTKPLPEKSNNLEK